MLSSINNINTRKLGKIEGGKTNFNNKQNLVSVVHLKIIKGLYWLSQGLNDNVTVIDF